MWSSPEIVNVVKNVIKLGRHVACMLARVEKYTDTFERKAQKKVPTWEI